MGFRPSLDAASTLGDSMSTQTKRRKEVKSMDETKRRLGLRSVLGILAVVIAASAFWAASAFAAGGSSSSERGTSDTPAAANVQNESGAPDDDCPNHGSDSDESSSA